MASKPRTIDEYLAALSDEKRAALEKPRRTIRAAAPKAEECISYQLAAFRQNGMLVAFGATANHCAFYLMSSSAVEAHKDELKDYDTSKGTIRFQADKPLPVALVRKLGKDSDRGEWGSTSNITLLARLFDADPSPSCPDALQKRKHRLEDGARHHGQPRHLEVLSDALGSVAVILAALIIRATGSTWVDPAASAAIGLFIPISTSGRSRAPCGRVMASGRYTTFTSGP